VTVELPPSDDMERAASKLDSPLAPPYLIVIGLEALVIVLLWALARAYS
jgi:hypothetical protein